MSSMGVERFQSLFQLMLRAIYGSEEQPWPRGEDDDDDQLVPPAGGLHLDDGPGDQRGGEGGDVADHVEDQGGVLKKLHSETGDRGGEGEEAIAGVSQPICLIFD